MTSEHVTSPMNEGQGLVDIHCHMLPGIDDGASNLAEALAMARLAHDDGIRTVVVTPHQLGSFKHNHGQTIRQATADFQQTLRREQIPLRVVPGADVRIEEQLARDIANGEVLTLADQGKHVLLELPHEIYFPLSPMLRQLENQGIVGILSHPERNLGIIQQRNLVSELVQQGCLMQITAGSLTGSMGKACQEVCHWMLQEGLVHFVATDAHGPTRRRPLLTRAWQTVRDLVGERAANELCRDFPRRVVDGQPVPQGRRPHRRPRRSWFGRKAS